MYINFGEAQFEFSTKMRVAQAVCAKYKKTTEELMSMAAQGLPGELVDILKMSLVDRSQAKELEDAIMDGDCGTAALRNHTISFLLELSYPGTAEEKEAAVASSIGASETEKNAIRGLLGLPLVQVSAPLDSGNP